MPPARESTTRPFLLQLRILRLGFFEDGDVGIGVFPEGEELLTAASPSGAAGRRSGGQRELNQAEGLL